jgi:hypothetical protein
VKLYLLWLCSLSSAALLLLWLALALHVRLGLGHWPTPMIENYRTTFFTVHYQILLGVGLFAVYGAAPLWFLLLCVHRFRGAWRTHIAQGVAYILGWIMMFLVVKFDPTTFTDWFLD